MVQELILDFNAKKRELKRGTRQNKRRNNIEESQKRKGGCLCICEERYQRLKGGFVVLFTFVYQRWMMKGERDVDSIGQDLGENWLFD